MVACNEPRFWVAGSGRWCGEVGGSTVDEECIPDEPMQWQLNRETWVCVDYEFSNPEAMDPDSEVQLSMYCLMTTAALATEDDSQFFDCERTHASSLHPT